MHHNLNNQQLKHGSKFTCDAGFIPAHHNLNNQQLKLLSSNTGLAIAFPAHHNLNGSFVWKVNKFQLLVV
jgi:hypothetical protein